jgi:putative ABC transport system permease protein
MLIFRLTVQSLKNRKTTAFLTLIMIAISVILLLGVERIKNQTKDNFSNSISGTDLIVGARSGQVNLLLYSVFHIGNATNNIDWQSVKEINQHRAVAWSIPISLGDSHRGFRVIGTNLDYFKHYKYGQKKSLVFKQGKPFSQLFDVVIGAEVAKKLNYDLQDKIIIAHGLSDKKFTRHANHPFTITGILAPTGTPVDKGIYVSLSAIEAIHGGAKSAVDNSTLKKDPNLSEPQQITALFLGLKSRIQVFSLQRAINQYKKEPLMAIIPSIALHELWQMMTLAEQALFIVSSAVVLAALLGMLTHLLTSLNERRREMAILRAVGAKPLHIFALFMLEALFLTSVGILIGLCALFLLTQIAAPYILNQYGFLFSPVFITTKEMHLLAFIALAAFIIGVLPAFKAYRQSLSDGMTIRI